MSPILNLLLFILSFGAVQVLACPSSNKEEFQESLFRLDFENEYQLGYNIPSESEIQETDFETIITAIKKVYTPEIKIISSWNSPVMNASADLDGVSRLVLLHGGFARFKYMTFDAYLLVVCHEVGHHLGGFPLRDKSSWKSSAEGQADYFASSKCFKNVLKASTEILNRNTSISIPQKSKKNCKDQYSSKLDYQICIRGAQAALDFGRMLSVYNYSEMDLGISLNKTMPPIRGQTYTVHSDPQCRTETLYQGILCNKDTNTRLSMNDETVGTCHAFNNDRIGLRPRCWFVPSV